MIRLKLPLLCSCLMIASFLTACSYPTFSPTSEGDQPVADKLTLTSTAFAEGQPIPKKYSCDAENVSPALKWSAAPSNTRSFALITDDPDARADTWVHWVIYNIPANLAELPEGVPTSDAVLNGALQGKNDFGKIGYGGPCPPRGNPHHYYFTLYALDTALTLQAGATKADLLRAMQGHILAQGQVIGTYKRA